MMKLFCVSLVALVAGWAAGSIFMLLCIHSALERNPPIGDYPLALFIFMPLLPHVTIKEHMAISATILLIAFIVVVVMKKHKKEALRLNLRANQ